MIGRLPSTNFLLIAILERMIIVFYFNGKYTPLFVEGLKVTVQISQAVLIGVVVGLVMALLDCPP